MNKNETRQRRARQTRIKIAELLAHRLTVIRSNCHISAQVYSPCGNKVIAAASTMEKDLRTSVKNGGNSQAAQEVGKLIAERAKKAGIPRNVKFGPYIFPMLVIISARGCLSSCYQNLFIN